MARISAEDYLCKDEEEVVEDVEETLVEHFDHEDFDYDQQEYEIVYESSLPDIDNDMMKTSPLHDQPIKFEMPKKSRKSRTLTISQKYNILKEIEEGKSVPQICSDYNIGRTTVYDFIKQKQRIIEYIEKSSDETRRTFKTSNYPEVEDSMRSWCERSDYFTKQQFYEKCKILFNHIKSSESTIPSQFCGSWSWCKRFFDRHPQFKRKLITPEGHPIDPASLSLGKFESIETKSKDDEKAGEKINVSISSHQKKSIKYLNFNEKIQVLSELDAGLAISVVADKWDVCKSTVYDIVKKRDELREMNGSKVSFRKVIKGPRHPILEEQLYDWCLSEETFPSFVLIADKALCLFDSMKLKGIFNPSSAWAKKFVNRHPELLNRLNEKLITKEIESNSLIVRRSFGDNVDDFIEHDKTESSDFIEQEYLEDDEENEYIVEELVGDNEETFETNNDLEVLNYAEIKVEPEEVSNEEAMKSLKTLIKYTEQKGHFDISYVLLEYQNHLEDKDGI